MWFEQAVVYQIYPLGLCGAPAENDGRLEHRILRLVDWAEHIRSLGADTVLLNPVFDSDRHGYDTRDYFHLDPRLGTDDDLAQVCRAFHRAGLRVLLDGVFNHVGRRRSGTAPIKTGSAWTSAAIPITTTAFGTRAGRATTSW